MTALLEVRDLRKSFALPRGVSLHAAGQRKEIGRAHV